MPNGSGVSDKTARAAEKCEKERRRYQFRLDYLKQEREEALQEFKIVDTAIKTLSIRERTVLTLHYRKHMSISNVAGAMHYSVDGMKSIIRRAKEKLKKIIQFEKMHTFAP